MAEKGRVNLNNYKGIYFGDDNKKFLDDETGAHFEFHDICRRLVPVQELRKKLDQRMEMKKNRDAGPSENFTDDKIQETVAIADMSKNAKAHVKLEKHAPNK